MRLLRGESAVIDLDFNGNPVHRGLSKLSGSVKEYHTTVLVNELFRRRAAWQAPPFKATRGTLYKYIKTVQSASEGCVTDE